MKFARPSEAEMQSLLDAGRYDWKGNLTSDFVTDLI